MEFSGRLHGYEFPPTETTGIGVTIASGADVSVANTVGTSVAVGINVDVSVGGMRVNVAGAVNVSAMTVF